MNLRDAAIGYAEAGLPVFPLVPGGKVPLTTRGLYAATIELIQITAWWARTPHANIGLPTGPKSGWDVLDVDVAKDEVSQGRQRRPGWEVVGPALRTGGLNSWYMPLGASQPRTSNQRSRCGATPWQPCPTFATKFRKS